MIVLILTQIPEFTNLSDMRRNWQYALLLLGLTWIIGIPVMYFLFTGKSDMGSAAMTHFASVFPIMGIWLILALEGKPLTRRTLVILFGSMVIQLVMFVQIMNLIP